MRDEIDQKRGHNCFRALSFVRPHLGQSPGRARAFATNPAFYHSDGMRPFVSLVCSPFHMNVRYLFNVDGHKEALMKMHH